jgi:hypothetical protein
MALLTLFSSRSSYRFAMTSLYVATGDPPDLFNSQVELLL